MSSPEPKRKKLKLQPSVKDGDVNSPSNDVGDDEVEYTEEALNLLPPAERKKIRNRKAAQDARNRKKEHMASLEVRVQKDLDRNAELKRQILEIQAQDAQILQEAAQFQQLQALLVGDVIGSSGTNLSINPTTEALLSEPLYNESALTNGQLKAEHDDTIQYDDTILPDETQHEHQAQSNDEPSTADTSPNDDPGTADISPS